MKGFRKVPLQEQIKRFAPNWGRSPLAAGLCDFDFFASIGEMLGQESRYRTIYMSYIAPYGSKNSDLKRIRDLVRTADTLPLIGRNRLLFYLLVEPFAALERKERT